MYRTEAFRTETGRALLLGTIFDPRGAAKHGLWAYLIDEWDVPRPRAEEALCGPPPRLWWDAGRGIGIGSGIGSGIGRGSGSGRGRGIGIGSGIGSGSGSGRGIGSGIGSGSGIGRGRGIGSGIGSGSGIGRGIGIGSGIGSTQREYLMEIGKAYLIHCGDWHTFVGRVVSQTGPHTYQMEACSKVSDTGAGDVWEELAAGDKRYRRSATYRHYKGLVTVVLTICAFEWVGALPQEVGTAA